jgi:hypothetical protein
MGDPMHKSSNELYDTCTCASADAARNGDGLAGASHSQAPSMMQVYTHDQVRKSAVLTTPMQNELDGRTLTGVAGQAQPLVEPREWSGDYLELQAQENALLCRLSVYV